jgi:hypothetical protein
VGVFRRDEPAIPAQARPYNTPRPLTAAASRINVSNKGEAEAFRKRRTSSASSWQSEAWEYYDAIGEIKYAFNLASQVISRIRLFAAVTEDVSEAPISVSSASKVDDRLAAAAERALARLDSAYGGQAGLLRDAALNLNVAGECYLVQIPERPGSGLPETWDIRSVDELQVTREGEYQIVPRRDLLSQAGTSGADQKGIITLPKGAYVGRLWRAHPRFSEEPDASLRGLLDLCDELLLLNKSFRATHRSRLNAGALYLPDGLSHSYGPDPDLYDEEGEPTGPTPDDMEDEFEEALIDAMTRPITDEDSASAVVPLIIRGPADLGEKIKQFKFERSFDAPMVERERRVLDRILQGLDVPKDLITGMANVKYSNAQQIDDSLYKSHIEPMIMLIADSITQIYLRPYLIAQGYTEAEVKRIVVWYDPSSISTRTDRASDADSGFEKNAISAETWRRAHGFSDGDAPTPNEYATKLLVSHGSLTPELTEAILTAIAPDIMNAAKGAAQAASPAPIPTDVQNVLQGGQPAATDTPEVDPASAGLVDPEQQNSTIPPDSDAPTEAGQDAPPLQV